MVRPCAVPAPSTWTDCVKGLAGCSARRGSGCALLPGWLNAAAAACGGHPSPHLPPPAPQVLSESHSHKGQRAPSPPLRVVPLFETLADLEASRGVMEVRAAAPRTLLRLLGGCCCCCCVRAACGLSPLRAHQPTPNPRCPDARQCLGPPCHHAAPAAACPVSRRRSSPTSGTAATWRRCTTTARRSCWAIPTRVGALVRGHAEVMLRSCWATPSRASVQHTLKRYGTCWAVLVARPWLPPSACLQPARRHA